MPRCYGRGTRRKGEEGNLKGCSHIYWVHLLLLCSVDKLLPVKGRHVFCLWGTGGLEEQHLRKKKETSKKDLVAPLIFTLVKGEKISKQTRGRRKIYIGPGTLV